MTETDFIIRAALSEETNSGWVWMQMTGKSFAPRTIVRIERRAGSRRFRIYVEVRKIDDNFRGNYNSGCKRIDLAEEHDTLVMAEWYREALEIPCTTSPDNETGRVRLTVARSPRPVWRSLRAACHHPDLAVRLGTRLGMVGVCLGVVGLWLGLLGTGALQGVRYGNEIFGFVGCIVLPILAIVAARGPRWSKGVE